MWWEHSNTVSYPEVICVEDITFVRAKAERHMGRALRSTSNGSFSSTSRTKKNDPDKMGVPHALINDDVYN